MKKIIFVLCVIFPLLYSCDEANEIIKNVLSDSLTEGEIIHGLKEALIVGTDSSVTTLSATDGYYKNEAVKILLPPEAEVIVDKLNNPLIQKLGLNKYLEDLIIQLNRSAEDAAKEAAPIFKNAITDMSIVDAKNILFGGVDSAATHYLREKTYFQLHDLFKPKISASLDKPLYFNVSANTTWTNITNAYNNVAKIFDWETVNTKLDDFITVKALNGLFYKVAEEEKNIRKDPLARVNDILKKVFGKLDKN